MLSEQEYLLFITAQVGALGGGTDFDWAPLTIFFRATKPDVSVPYMLIGRSRMTRQSGNVNATSYLKQRLSIAIQQGNALSYHYQTCFSLCVVCLFLVLFV